VSRKCRTAKSGCPTTNETHPLVIECRLALCFASKVCIRGPSKLLKVIRKFAAIAALLGLFLPGVSALAETLSAGNLPSCCNTVYCPMHHRQMSDVQRDKANCGAMGATGQRDCSMRACDAAPNQAVGTAPFVLVTPVALRGPSIAEATLFLAAQFSPYVVTIPSTPPPRTLLS
jgi:hypothetical protein